MAPPFFLGRQPTWQSTPNPKGRNMTLDDDESRKMNDFLSRYRTFQVASKWYNSLVDPTTRLSCWKMEACMPLELRPASIYQSWNLSSWYLVEFWKRRCDILSHDRTTVIDKGGHVYQVHLWKDQGLREFFPCLLPPGCGQDK
jgi:hypothetical protein